MDNVTPLRKPPTGLCEAVEQVWADYNAGRLDGGRQGEGITHERLGFEAWMRLPDEQRTNDYLFALGAYAAKVLDEQRHRDQQDRPFDVADLIVGIEYSLAGELADPSRMDADSLDFLTGEVIASIPATEVLVALGQALAYAIPVVLREALARQQQRQAT